jgi:hypothetical protein
MENDGREISVARRRKLLTFSGFSGENGWGQLVNEFITFLRHYPQGTILKALGGVAPHCPARLRVLPIDCEWEF